MKVVGSSCCSFPHLGRHLSTRVFASLYSSRSPAPSSPESLLHRLEPIGDPRASVTPVLEQWIEEGKPVSRHKLRSLIHFMKEFKRFSHALEISLWMIHHRYSVTPSDAAQMGFDLQSSRSRAGGELLQQHPRYFKRIQCIWRSSQQLHTRKIS